MQMLDYFVKEQGEEEANARDMISNMKLFGCDPRVCTTSTANTAAACTRR